VAKSISFSQRVLQRKCSRKMFLHIERTKKFTPLYWLGLWKLEIGIRLGRCKSVDFAEVKKTKLSTGSSINK
jgi:hypothetical protein